MTQKNCPHLREHELPNMTIEGRRFSERVASGAIWAAMAFGLIVTRSAASSETAGVQSSAIDAAEPQRSAREVRKAIAALDFDRASDLLVSKREVLGETQASLEQEVRLTRGVWTRLRGALGKLAASDGSGRDGELRVAEAKGSGDSTLHRAVEVDAHTVRLAPERQKKTERLTVAILSAVRGSFLRELIWESPTNNRLGDSVRVGAVMNGGQLRWTLNGRSLPFQKAPGLRAFEEKAPHSGSVTLFTNRSTVLYSRIEVRAKVRPEWYREQATARAKEEVDRLLSGGPGASASDDV